ncbi:MAG: carbamoylphosphate synthase large subunit [Clostridiales bacterium]|nr:carbamoylphosphate synthase large subunit [Clostridiales bacterium]
MKNVVFLSPNHPANYWHFCYELKQNGLRVLGIGDAPYDSLRQELKESLHEYYRVESLENYEEVYRAVAYFIHRYGTIDWLESNNDDYAERDARLRTAYCITSGLQEEEVARIRSKSGVKEIFQQAGIQVARWHMVDDFKHCAAFIREVGYPVVVKADCGMRSDDTRKLHNDEELKAFLESREPEEKYLLEELVHGELVSYDAVIDASGEPIFETGNVTPFTGMMTAKEKDNAIYYAHGELPGDTREAGRAAVKHIGIRSRFVHLAFFRLTQDHPGLGKKGKLVALEATMGTAGGYWLDMINFANGTDVYKIWADMIAFGESQRCAQQRGYCAFVGRRDGKRFIISHERLMRKYRENLRMVQRVPEELTGLMANQMYVAVFETKEEMDAFCADALWCENVA